jgi:hypothetical protein
MAFRSFAARRYNELGNQRIPSHASLFVPFQTRLIPSSVGRIPSAWCFGEVLGKEGRSKVTTGAIASFSDARRIRQGLCPVGEGSFEVCLEVGRDRHGGE